MCFRSSPNPPCLDVLVELFVRSSLSHCSVLRQGAAWNACRSPLFGGGGVAWDVVEAEAEAEGRGVQDSAARAVSPKDRDWVGPRAQGVTPSGAARLGVSCRVS